MFKLKIATVFVIFAALYRIYWIIVCPNNWVDWPWEMIKWMLMTRIEDFLIIATASILIKEVFFSIKEAKIE